VAPDTSHEAVALEEAVHANDVRRVAALLESSPSLRNMLNDPMPSAAFGTLPLLAAVHSGRREMVDVLLRYGADINARSHWWAGSFGVLDDDGGLAAYLIERGAVVDACAAARLGMIDRLRDLIAADAGTVHARGGDGQTPLHFAATVEIAALLVAHGADIDAVDVDHESTPAQYMLRDRPDVARSLVRRGCRTDLLMAAALGDVDLAREHLDRDADLIRMRVSSRWFPMRDPRAGGTIYQWVLERSATPHQAARMFGNAAMIELLTTRSPRELQFAEACSAGDVPAVESLLHASPALVERLSADDLWRLPHAAEKNDAAAVQLMLSIGWPIQTRGDLGETALHWAAWHGNVDMTKALLRHGAAVDVRSAVYDATPAQWAAHRAAHGPHPSIGDFAAVADLLRSARTP